MNLDETDLDTLEAAAAGILYRTPAGTWYDTGRRDFTDRAPRLERAGLIERIDAPDTRGNIPVQLTAAGHNARQQARAVR